MIQDIGSDTMPEIQYDMKKANVAKYDMNKIANMFYFNRSNPHFYWEISRNYLCMTQSYGHIPGFLSLARTDFSLKLMNGYAKKYENNKKCFDMDRFIPTTYRLNDPDECTEFFEIINSDHYKKFREADKIMFLLKSLTLESKHPRGVYLFDEKEEINLRRQLKEGKGCKDFKNAIVIQKYITSPLLLNKYQNFELKTYMLVSSVQPLIVYYHDGLAHLSSKSYQQNSIGKNAQFTDEDKKIDHKLHKEYYKDMTETEFKESLTWSMEKLVKNLVDTKNINDTNWLNSYLRPKIQEAFTHLIRISQQGFFKHPGVWELFEVSFLLDENLKVWYIKSKISPIVDGATQVEKKFMANMLKDMLDIQFAYLRSRFKKLQEFLSILLEQTAQVARVDKNAVKVVFEEINRNSLEKEFKIAANNSFTLIMDKNIKGIEGFMGHLKTDCFENADKE
jgi:tubulin polyglutamylase TTLL1